ANLEITERSPPGFDNHLQHGHVPPWPEEKERRLPLNTRTALPAPQQHDALLPEPIGKAHRVESVGSAAGVQHQRALDGDAELRGHVFEIENGAEVDVRSVVPVRWQQLRGRHAPAEEQPPTNAPIAKIGERYDG